MWAWLKLFNLTNYTNGMGYKREIFVEKSVQYDSMQLWHKNLSAQVDFHARKKKDRLRERNLNPQFSPTNFIRWTLDEKINLSAAASSSKFSKGNKSTQRLSSSVSSSSSYCSGNWGVALPLNPRNDRNITLVWTVIQDSCSGVLGVWKS